MIFGSDDRPIVVLVDPLLDGLATDPLGRPRVLLQGKAKITRKNNRIKIALLKEFALFHHVEVSYARNDLEMIQKTKIDVKKWRLSGAGKLKLDPPAHHCR
jgi:hypothetical protein